MDEKYSCPHCGQHVIIPNAPRGALLDCPNCKQPFRLDNHAGVERRLAMPWVWCIGALLAIGISAPFVYKLTSTVNSRDSSVRQFSPQGAIGTDASDPIFSGKALSAWVEEVGSLDPATSRRAREALRDNSGIVKPLLAHLIQGGSGSSRMRDQAPAALGSIIKPDDPEIHVLLDALQSKDRVLRSSAMAALRRQHIDGKVVVPLLMVMSASSNASIRRTAAQYLGDFASSDAQVMATLQRMTSDTDSNVRDTASLSLVRDTPPNLVFGNQDLTGALRDLSSGDAATRKSARDRLREIGGAAVPDLIAAMENKQATGRDRALAAQALGYTGKNREPEVPALITALNDSDSVVREYAAASLGLLNLDPKVFVPMCLEMFSDKSTRVRRRAAENLARIGPAARDAIPILKQVVEEEPDTLTRNGARLAIQKINALESASEKGR